MVVKQQVDVQFYRLNIGQPDVPTPAPILDAINSWRPDVIAYGPASGLASCREAAAAYHSRWSPELDASHVAVTQGGSEALLFAFCALCDSGDEILVPEPYYTNYNGFATVAGAKIVSVPTHLEDGFNIPDNATLDSYVTERTKAILFSNPGNPTGAVYSAAELQRVIDWAVKRGIFIISDEVYRRIWFTEPPVSALEFEHARDNVIIVDSLSKTYSACGIRVGFLISRNAHLMEKVERLGQARLGVQPLAQAAALAALSLPEGYYEEVRHIYKARVDTMINALGRIDGASCHQPEGAFYTMVRLPIDDSDRFARFLITDFRDAGESLVVAPGGGFYSDPARGIDQIRLAAVMEPARIERAIDILGKAVAAYTS